MTKKIAVISFLTVCIVLAVLLLTKSISSFVSGIVFAVALVIFGTLSKGFRSNNASYILKK
jgi:predicted membrane protein